MTTFLDTRVAALNLVVVAVDALERSLAQEDQEAQKQA
jgi:hypothetical protein